jgi:hypothetical protein
MVRIIAPSCEALAPLPGVASRTDCVAGFRVGSSQAGQWHYQCHYNVNVVGLNRPPEFARILSFFRGLARWADGVDGIAVAVLLFRSSTS